LNGMHQCTALQHPRFASAPLFC